MSEAVVSKTSCKKCGFVLKPGQAGPCPKCGGNVNHDVSIEARIAVRGDLATEITRYTQEQLLRPDIRQEIALASPTFSVLMQLLRQSRDLYSLSPREFEELIQQLLDADGWTTRLGRGQKDGGWDVWAEKNLGTGGFVAAIWQAKKPEKIKNKVDVGIVRELFGTVGLENVNKGVIATTSYLTKDALRLVEQQKYHLAKCDSDDFRQWLQRHARL